MGTSAELVADPFATARDTSHAHGLEPAAALPSEASFPTTAFASAHFHRFRVKRGAVNREGSLYLPAGTAAWIPSRLFARFRLGNFLAQRVAPNCR